jgi:hypothetical protein
MLSSLAALPNGDFFLANAHRIFVTGPTEPRAAERTIEP